MTSDDLEDEYPHWRTALFGNHNAVANIRCAAHYLLWHGAYTLIAIVGAVLLGIVTVGETVAPLFGPLGAPIKRGFTRVRSGISTVANHEYTEKIAEIFLIVFWAVGLICVIVMFAYFLYTQFWSAVSILVGATIVGGLFFAVSVAYATLEDPAKSLLHSAATTTRSVGEKATETPGIRRVYGECPVSLQDCPHWFEKLFPEDEY